MYKNGLVGRRTSGLRKLRLVIWTEEIGMNGLVSKKVGVALVSNVVSRIYYNELEESYQKFVYTPFAIQLVSSSIRAHSLL